MDKVLHANAAKLLDAAPCSLEMPAGTGKTHLLAAAAATAGNKSQRSLILTHTNAGVDAIRKRLRRFGVPPNQFRVDTITSWAFSLVRSYPVIADISVSSMPDWTKSHDYLIGATAVARSKAISEVHSLSFDYLFVDEYQDCTIVLHEFVIALAASIPKTVILGDRLQAIFTFTGPMATWGAHVTPNFPKHTIEYEPHRWSEHNVSLGRWLLDIRSDLKDGSVFDFSSYTVPGLNYIPASDPKMLTSIAHSFRNFNETVVLLDKWPNDIANHASRLGGNYSVMEDINGNFMRAQLERLPHEGDRQLARWFAVFAKSCFVGLSGIDAPVLKRLQQGLGIIHYKRPGLEAVISVLDRLQQNPTYNELAFAVKEISIIKGLRIYRWEAWKDTCEAIAMTLENSEPVVYNLARVRDRLRQSGRRDSTRVASRTLLVKGLEYDHVVIADLSKMRDPCNLYVALSRARKSITVLGEKPQIMLKEES